jgi:hypothetical protein
LAWSLHRAFGDGDDGDDIGEDCGFEAGEREARGDVFEANHGLRTGGDFIVTN